MAENRFSARVVAPALLIAGVLGASGLFYRSRLPGEPGGTATHPAAPSSPSMAPAPSGARPGPAGGGDVAALFRERVAALEARLGDAPDDRDALLELARLLHDGHRVPDAIPYYRRARALNRKDAQVTYDLASAHAEVGEWEQAAAVLLDRLDDDPGDAVALYNLGAVRANQGRTADAVNRLTQAQGATSDGALLARISQALARLKGGQVP